MTLLSMRDDDRRELICIILYDVENDTIHMEFPKSKNSKITMESNLAIFNKFFQQKFPFHRSEKLNDTPSNF